MNKLIQKSVSERGGSSKQITSWVLVSLLLVIPVLAFVAANRGSVLVYLFDGSIRTFTGHSDDINSIAFSPDGLFVLSGSRDRTLKLWDVKTGRELRTFMGHTESVSSVAFSPDGRFALSEGSDSTLKLWDIKTGLELHSFRGHTQSVNSIAFSPDGRFALSGSWDKSIKLWDIPVEYLPSP